MTRTSVSLPGDVAAELVRRGSSAKRRSALVTKALRAFFRKGEPADDSAILERHAKELNEEAEDVLRYQKLP